MRLGVAPANWLLQSAAGAPFVGLSLLSSKGLRSRLASELKAASCAP